MSLPHRDVLMPGLQSGVLLGLAHGQGLCVSHGVQHSDGILDEPGHEAVGKDESEG